MHITFYSNGFTVDDGEFRDYEDPINKEFMEDVKKGYLPKELAQKFGRNVGIAVQDRRNEEFKKPPPPKERFGGQAVTLGGASAATTVASEVNTAN